MKTSHRLLILILLLLTPAAFPVNILTVQDPGFYGSKPGFIDRATLVVEPHGAYIEQSLYLEYSDHGQYPGKNKIEIVHRFELPPGSVINDLWLWIGDSVMQAIMLDTWTARAIYDSIVAVKRDPAFLTKTGNQYELHVYPLLSGSFRKIKLNFITPTQWRGTQATASLPLPLLLANNAAKKPLDILFRTQERVWGQPSILEKPDLIFQTRPDTLDFQYLYLGIPDLSVCNSLNIGFQTLFQNGYLFRSNQREDQPTYFQIGISPGEFFKLASDSSVKEYVIGLDLSGLYNKNLDVLLPHINSVLGTGLGEDDRFQVFVTGSGKYQRITSDWLPASAQNIAAVMTEFEQTDLAREISAQKLPHIVYCDDHATVCWSFPGIEKLATTANFRDITSALYYFTNADNITAYDHGYEAPLSDLTLDRMTAALDSFFLNGGRLLTFYDYNRVGKEKLATHYINSLTTTGKMSGDVYRNLTGNIGRNFPESIYHPVINLLSYSDPDVKPELVDKNGRPTVISKKIKNGLLVVSGIWSFKDDGALRALLGAPLLGLNSVSTHRQLPQLLTEIRNFHATDAFDKVILFSNSDSLVLEYQANLWINNYLSNFSPTKPSFNSINLLDGSTVTPPYFSQNGIDYYGSGYFLKLLADNTYGLHFETHVNDWDFIGETLASGANRPRESFEIKVTGDAGEQSLIDFREVDPRPNDPLKPIFYMGATTSMVNLHFDISAKYAGIDSQFTRKLDFTVAHDTTQKGNIIPSMLGYEALKDLFAETEYDTAAIVKLAMQYNLLCDFTALLALEPNDTLHFMKNPFIEEPIVAVENNAAPDSDSLSFKIFPNPFNARTQITVSTPFLAEVRLQIYNICGQLVHEFERSQFTGARTFTWEGQNSAFQPVSSGVYFARVQFINPQTKKSLFRMQRMVLLR